MHGPVASHIIIHEQHHTKLKKIQLPFHSLAITKKHVFVGCGEYDSLLPLLDNNVKSGSWTRLTQVDIILKHHRHAIPTWWLYQKNPSDPNQSLTMFHLSWHTFIEGSMQKKKAHYVLYN